MFFPEPLPERVFRGPRSRSIMKGWFLGPPRESRNANMRFRGPTSSLKMSILGYPPIRGNGPGTDLFRFLRIFIDIYVFSRFLEIFIAFGPLLDHFWTDFGPSLERF